MTACYVKQISISNTNVPDYSSELSLLFYRKKFVSFIGLSLERYVMLFDAFDDKSHPDICQSIIIHKLQLLMKSISNEREDILE